MPGICRAFSMLLTQRSLFTNSYAIVLPYAAAQPLVSFTTKPFRFPERIGRRRRGRIGYTAVISSADQACPEEAAKTHRNSSISAHLHRFSCRNRDNRPGQALGAVLHCISRNQCMFGTLQTLPFLALLSQLLYRVRQRYAKAPSYRPAPSK